MIQLCQLFQYLENPQEHIDVVVFGHTHVPVFQEVKNSKYYISRGVTYIKNNGNMLMFTLGYTFSHGRKYKTDRRILNNSDKDTGLR